MIGAVLSHVAEDEQERPIDYTSGTLTIADNNYLQLEKEVLDIIFAVKKFHTFVDILMLFTIVKHLSHHEISSKP